MSHIITFLREVGCVAERLDAGAIEKIAAELESLRARNGRLFLIGVGGSAGNCSHAVNDFRKLCGIEAYAPIDNVSELTARANDEGWETIFSGWLEVSRLNSADAIFVMSVGGGDVVRNVSVNIVRAIDLAKVRGARVLGIVGKPDGYTAQMGDAVVVVPTVNPDRVTPLSEAFQAVIWHGLVSHPILQLRRTKW
ncbi:MAG: SIS domain-containing protein [Alphaproteobacteria bacterium]|nr:SIS domain-containing protein [Alphaproteobacteria bacterium]